MEPYYEDNVVSLYVGDCRTVLPALGVIPDLVLADPPYGASSYEWDRWPEGWPQAVAETGARAMWCFGSARMFDTYRDDLRRRWHLSQEVVWFKGATGGAGQVNDRFAVSHELVRFYYRGQWSTVYHDSPRQSVYGTKVGRTVDREAKEAGWHGSRGDTTWVDDGTRMVLSVIYCRSMVKRAIHPNEKSVGILDPLIRYACPPGGLVVDPFGGSCSTALAARQLGRRAICIELLERHAEKSAKRLAQQSLFDPQV